MKLIMWRGTEPNFGDDLNNWIWPKLIPEVLDDFPTDLFVGIGTLLNHRLPVQQHKVVFGSGAGYGDRPDLKAGRWSFYCVRGPLTAQALGLPAPLAVADPGILVRTLFDGKSNGHTGPVGFMPHKDSAASGRWHDICAAADILYIDPRESVDDGVVLDLRLSPADRRGDAWRHRGGRLAGAVGGRADHTITARLQMARLVPIHGAGLPANPNSGKHDHGGSAPPLWSDPLPDCPDHSAAKGSASAHRGASEVARVAGDPRCRYAGSKTRNTRSGHLRKRCDKRQPAA